MKIGGKYNWKGQPERLIYLGYNWSGNGLWHQFEKVDEPGKIWCEVLDSDLRMIEETATKPFIQACRPEDQAMVQSEAGAAMVKAAIEAISAQESKG